MESKEQLISKLNDSEQIPAAYICPLSFNIMLFPVVLPILINGEVDGYTFEREIIEGHLQKNPLCPISQREPDSKKVIRNRSLEETIAVFLTNNPDFWYLVHSSQSLLNQLLTALKEENIHSLDFCLTKDRRFLLHDTPIIGEENLFELVCKGPSLKVLRFVMEQITPSNFIWKTEKFSFHENFKRFFAEEGVRLCFTAAKNTGIEGAQTIIKTLNLDHNKIEELLSMALAEKNVEVVKIALLLSEQLLPTLELVNWSLSLPQPERIEILKYLIKNDQPIKDREDETLLNFAVNLDNSEVVEELLLNGANIYHKDKKGNTALHYAVMKNNQLIVRMLMQHGAKFDAINNDDKMPINIAYPNQELFKYMLKLDEELKIAPILPIVEEQNRTIAQQGAAIHTYENELDGQKKMFTHAIGKIAEQEKIINALKKQNADLEIKFEKFKRTSENRFNKQEEKTGDIQDVIAKHKRTIDDLKAENATLLTKMAKIEQSNQALEDKSIKQQQETDDIRSTITALNLSIDGLKNDLKKEILTSQTKIEKEIEQTNQVAEKQGVNITASEAHIKNLQQGQTYLNEKITPLLPQSKNAINKIGEMELKLDQQYKKMAFLESYINNAHFSNKNVTGRLDEVSKDLKETEEACKKFSEELTNLHNYIKNTDTLNKEQHTTQENRIKDLEEKAVVSNKEFYEKFSKELAALRNEIQTISAPNKAQHTMQEKNKTKPLEEKAAVPNPNKEFYGSFFPELTSELQAKTKCLTSPSSKQAELLDINTAYPNQSINKPNSPFNLPSPPNFNYEADDPFPEFDNPFPALENNFRLEKLNPSISQEKGPNPSNYPYNPYTQVISNQSFVDDSRINSGVSVSNSCVNFPDSTSSLEPASKKLKLR